jgi:hypothetical protein
VRGRTTYYVYDAVHQLVAEADQNGEWLRQHLYINGRPVLLQAEGAAQTGSLYAVHVDQRGLPLAVTDDQRRGAGLRCLWQCASGTAAARHPGRHP